MQNLVSQNQYNQNPEVHPVEGIKACQIAGQSIGKYGKEGNGSLETRCVESSLAVYVCLSLLYLIDAKRHFLCP